MSTFDSLESRMARFAEVDIYPVTSKEYSVGRDSLEILDAIIKGGARIVQLREKSLCVRDLHALAVAFRKRTHEAGLLLMINDHLDIALAVGADGVHLGQDDFPIAQAKRLASELIVGVSTHSIDEAIEAQAQGADAINIGPIFATPTKQLAPRFLGLDGLKEIIPHVRVPFTVMGGLKADNIDPLLCLGVSKIAVVSAITAAIDPVAATIELRKRIQQER